MNLRTPMLGGVMSFAHLAGLGGRKSKAKAEDDTDRKPDAEDDEDEEDKPKGRKAKGRAEDESDDDKKPGAEDGDEDCDDDEDDDKPAAEDDDVEEGDEDDGDDKKGKSKGAAASQFKAGRKAERRRCGRIFSSPAAARNPALAAHLAFNTGMSSASVIQALETSPGDASAARNARRADRNPDLGADSTADHRSSSALAAGWDRAAVKAGVREAPAPRR